MRLAKRGIQNEVMGEVFLQDQGGVGGFFSLKVFSFKYRFFFLNKFIYSVMRLGIKNIT